MYFPRLVKSLQIHCDQRQVLKTKPNKEKQKQTGKQKPLSWRYLTEYDGLIWVLIARKEDVLFKKKKKVSYTFWNLYLIMVIQYGFLASL